LRLKPKALKLLNLYLISSSRCAGEIQKEQNQPESITFIGVLDKPLTVL